MNIVVTGGLGFVGSNLCKRLIKEGHDVIVVDDMSTGDYINSVDGVKYIIWDVADYDPYLLDNLIKNKEIDVIFHLAALSRIQPSFQTPSETYKANTTATQRILEFARIKKVKRLIYSGSSSRWHNPYISPYATYKYLGEEICKMYRTVYDMNIHIARFYNVYGLNEITKGDWAAVIGKWRNQIEKNEPITIVGDGQQRRAFTHVDDIVDGLMKIMTTEHEVDDAWELGMNKNYSMIEVFNLFKERFPDTKSVFIADQKGNYRETIQTDIASNLLLNWYPEKQLEDYIKNL